jgi:anaerobic selenocysteine-containing dehydrogenase
VPFAQFAPAVGNRSSLNALNDGLAAGKYKVVFSYGTNPVFTAPSSMKFRDNSMKAGFKVAFAQYMDETAKAADLVLPLDSPMEDWATVVPEYMAAPEGAYSEGYAQMSFRQPTMDKLYPNTDGSGTRGVCDILVTLLKQRKPQDFKDVNDFYTYLHADVLKKKTAMGGSATEDDDMFWNDTVSKGIVALKGVPGKLAARPSVAGMSLPAPVTPDASYPLRLIPHVSASIRDGRNANEPWLQESPDPLTTIVWDSWVEIHPKTAEKLGIAEGDIVQITSRSGSIQTQAYIFPGIHPDAISVPVGYGHDAMGRWAQGTGANVFSILDPVFDKQTGELAMNETNVKITKVGQRVIVIKDEGFAGGSQAGKKKIAVKVSASKVDLSKEV